MSQTRIHNNSKGPKNRGYWLSPTEIARQLPTVTNGSVCYELGATGSIHAGSLRAFHFVEQLQRAAATVGKDLGYVLRLNDLAPSKFSGGDNAAGRSAGARIAAEICDADGRTLLEKIQEEIQIIYKRTGWNPPRVLLVSEIYRSDRFIRKLEAALRESDVIVERLAKFKNSPVSIHSPICPRCRRVRSSQPIDLETDETQWRCYTCHAQFEYVPGRSLGLVTFKLEQALIWQFCSAVVDVHGQDHVEAFDASCDIARILKFETTPLAGRLNLVFDRHRAKLSKSQKNFTPVVELQPDDLRELISTYERTPYWRPIIRDEDGLDAPV